MKPGRRLSVAAGAVDVAEEAVVMAADAAAMEVAVVAEAGTAEAADAAVTAETAVIVGNLSFKILERRPNP